MRRLELDIKKDILIIAAPKGEADEKGVKNGATKTYIRNKGGLNYPQQKLYLKELIETKLLKKEGSIHTTTQKGLEFLEKYCEHQKIVALHLTC